MAEIGCYTMDLYCDHDNKEHEYREFPHQFTGPDRASCAVQAKMKGWRFNKNKTRTCPRCNHLPTPEPPKS